MASLQSDFLNGNSDYPIPYDTVMVATFMLPAIQSMTEIHNLVSKLEVAGHIGLQHVVHCYRGDGVAINGQRVHDALRSEIEGAEGLAHEHRHHLLGQELPGIVENLLQ